ncbi:7096_t:CDS:1, partial [Racocetra persica]
NRPGCILDCLPPNPTFIQLATNVSSTKALWLKLLSNPKTSIVSGNAIFKISIACS